MPALDVQLPGTLETLLTQGSDAQLQAITPFERIGPEQADAHLRIAASENTRALTGIDPARHQRYTRARAAIHQRFLDRAASGALRWTLTLYPTAAFAQEAEMSLRDYEAFVVRAARLDDPDPVARWQELAAFQAALIDWLRPRSTVRILAEDTDLTLRVDGRAWVNSDGRHNFPSGEVFTGPIEDSVNGDIRFSFPSIVQGQEVDDVRLRFEDGRVVRATAGKNQALLDAMLATDDGARFVGEFAFGTNPTITRFTRNTLFDEKIGGTVHLALGSGYPETGSRNRSAIHWDLIRDTRGGGEVRVDGEVILKDGRFATDVIGNWTGKY